MSAPRLPRVVIVTRKSPLELLLARHGTVSQAEFYLRSRGEAMAPFRALHDQLATALRELESALPAELRRTRVDRDQLDRFQFAPDDVIVIVGQDGLVANVAKYLSGQLTIGVNPAPDEYDGVLCAFAAREMPELIGWLLDRRSHEFVVQERSMVVAEREDGQRLLALNEIFVGHERHQSARYRLRVGEVEERQSSSGIICATPTGCTGWARSIAGQRGISTLPAPTQDRAVWFVREPFPSVSTQVSLDTGSLTRASQLEVVSEMGEGGVVFADGIEVDRLEFSSGQRVVMRLAEERLALAVRASEVTE